MLIIPDSIAASLIDFSAIVGAIERAFMALDDGVAENFPVIHGRTSRTEDSFAIKSCFNGAISRSGLKIGTYFPGNSARGLPAHSSTIIVLDDQTGRPAAVIGANSLNGMRTAAVNAIGTRLLARNNASTLGVVGAGHQAVYEAIAVCSVRPIERILVWSPSGGLARPFAVEVGKQTTARIEAVDLPYLVSQADVLVTVTPSRTPIVERKWLKKGVHISAMGADAIGKQELDPSIFRKAKLYVDCPDQAKTIGESQHAFKLGYISETNLNRRTLGRLLNSKEDGRISDDDITILDSSGMALQDIAVANLVLERAAVRNDIVDIPLF